MAVELNINNFENVLSTDKLIVLDFWASWCEPCKAILPIFEEVSSELKDRVVMGKIKVDDNRELARRYRVMSVPSFVFIKNNEVIEYIPMVIDKQTLLNKINLYI